MTSRIMFLCYKCCYMVLRLLCHSLCRTLQRIKNAPATKNIRHSWLTLEAAMQQIESETIKFQMLVLYKYSNISTDIVCQCDNESPQRPYHYHFGILASRCHVLWDHVGHLVTTNDTNRFNKMLANYSNNNNFTLSSHDESSQGNNEDIEIRIGTTRKTNKIIDTDQMKVENQAFCDSNTSLHPHLLIRVRHKDVVNVGTIQHPTVRTVECKPELWKSKSTMHSGRYDYPTYDTFHSKQQTSSFRDIKYVEQQSVSSTSSLISTKNNKYKYNTTNLIKSPQLLMTVSEYLQVRLGTKVEERKRMVQWMQTKKYCIDILVQYLTMSTCVLAIISYQWAIPIVLALAVACTSSKEYREYDNRIATTKQSINTLDSIQTWWQQLSFIDQKQEKYIEELVNKTEDAIISKNYNDVQI